jgi:PTH1 family peptidyl-tRNA hydrolase
MVVAALGERWSLGREKDRYRARLSEGRVPGLDGTGGPRVAVMSPQTFMNDVGRSVGPARGAYRLAPERVLVVHDEIDLPFGDVRTRLGGGLAGHNGLKSVRAALGSSEFMRVRAGVGRPDSTDPEIVSAYVLGRFRESPGEVGELIDRACGAVEDVVLGKAPTAARPAGEMPPSGGEGTGGDAS